MAPPLRRRLGRGDRAAARRAARARGDRRSGRACSPTCLGAARVVARGRRACSRAWARASRRGRSCSTPTRTRRDDGSTPTVEHECFPSGGHETCAEIARHLAARRDGEGAGERRRAAADRRPAGVPALARAGRRSAQRVARAAGRRPRPADRRLRASGPQPAGAPPTSWPQLVRPRSPSPTSRGRGRCRSARGSPTSWPGIKEAKRAPRRRPARRGAAPARAGCAPGSGSDFRLEPRGLRGAEARSRSTASRSAVRRRPSLAERPALGRSSRSSGATAIYEAAVRAV